ncbi:MAG: hypothetical protein P4L62_04700 [Candidatus Pacebacteria bacterium]|nr:hypothetical protein [Candidatus Paceibacterota bacterium]MDR3583631.1 hypothetical protein [Candidatus Paceibacterota bacterium]
MDTNVSQKVIDKIKKERLAPKSGWHFFLLRAAVLAGLSFFILAGALSFGIIFDIVRQVEITRIIGRPGGPGVVLLSLPYLWIIFVVFFLVLALADFARTRHGYKYRLLHIGVALFVGMFFLGAVFHALGYCDSIEMYLENQFPLYSRIVATPQGVWSRPSDGLLSGMIVQNDNVMDRLELEDWRSNRWDVDYSQATIEPQVSESLGEMIKVIGDKQADHNFKAEDIRPWDGEMMRLPPPPDLKGAMPPVRPGKD